MLPSTIVFLKSYGSYENNYIEQVQTFSLSQWVKFGDVYNSSLQRKTWRGGRSQSPVIMESTPQTHGLSQSE